MSVNFENLHGRAVESYEDALAFRRAIEQLIPTLRDNGKYVIPRGNVFWTFYHAHKAELRHARLFVFKEGSDWVLAANPLYDPEDREKKLLSQDFEKWRAALVGCCVPFARMQIDEHVKKNGVKWYRLLCPVCKDWRSGGLPFRLVASLLKDGGLELVVRSDRVRQGVRHG